MEPLWLAIETSRRAATLCLQKGNLRYEAQLQGERPQSSMLLPLVQDFLASCEVTPAEVTDLAMHVGPGGATGLRMGIAMAQAWSMVHDNLRVHAIPLEAMAEQVLKQEESNRNENVTQNNSVDEGNANKDRGGEARCEAANCDKALLIADAFAGQVFIQSFSRHEKGWSAIQPLTLQNVEVCDTLGDEPLLVIEDLGRLKAKRDWPSSWTWSALPFVHATRVLDAAIMGAHLKPIQDCDVRYLKASSAEILWNERHGISNSPVQSFNS